MAEYAFREMNRTIETVHNPRIDWVRLALMIIFAIVLVVVIIGLYWLIWDDNPPIVIKTAVPNKTILTPGESFVITMDFCKQTNSAASVSLTWIDDLLFIEPPTFPFHVEPGCYIYNVSSTVPATLPPSNYTVYGIAEYDVNPLAHRVVDFEIGSIVVVDPT